MKRVLLVVAAIVFFTHAASAQNSHGSIAGQVTDSSGAVIPKAQVTVTDTDTGAIFHVVTTKEGFYTAPELQAGPYKITVEMTGFKTLVREGVNVETQANLTVNLKLSVGETQQTIDVSSDAPMIDTADASTGQVLTNQEVEDLPSNGRNPLAFARIEYGAVPKAKHADSAAGPQGQQTADDFSLGGGNSASNEILLNGVPNFQDSGRNAGYSPALDSVNEVRVDVFGANAMYGDTSGGTVNVTTKSGTNRLHGSGSWFYQAAGCSSQYGSFVSRSANHCEGLAALTYLTNKPGAALPQATHQNQLAGTIGGPVFIPKIFNGRDKLFFFYAYEAYVGSQPPVATIGTVPTAAERTGDFSALLALGSAYQLYNPNTAVGSQSNYTRSKIPGNILANAGLQVNPIATAYYQYVPLPNYNGATTTADGQNNYFTYTPATADYRSHSGRIEYNLGSRDKVFGEAHRSRYLTQASNYFHNSSTGTRSDQILSGGLLEDVHTFSPTAFLDIRGGVSRYDNTNFISSSGISPTSLGLPGYLAANSTAIALPQFTFGDATAPLSFGNQPGSIENFDTIQLFTNFTKLVGPHSFKAGIDFRAYKLSQVPPGAANGTFSFSKANGNPVSLGPGAPAATFGSSFALLDLGIPTGGSYNIAPALQNDSFLFAYFLQDDWKLRQNVTISVGVRFEHETPVVESNNRMVNGFNPAAINSATAGAIAAYPNNAILPAASFQPTGGVTFASAANRTAYTPAPLYFSPRIGMTYAPEALKGKGVIRFGYGIYTNPFNDYNTGQTYGFTGTRTYTQTSNSGITNGTLNAPFPAATNPIQIPTGSALGVNTNLGSKVVYYYPNVKVPYSERTSVDLQYQIGNSVMVELGYINNHQVHLSYANAVDAIPLLPYLSRSPYYDGAVTNFLSGTTYSGSGATSTNIANPFKGQPGVTGTLATASLLAPSSYLLTNPEFTSVTEQLVPGSASNYNALNARVYKKMSHGLTVNGVFEWSRLLGTFNQLNAGDVLNYGETTSDYPFHFSGYGTYQLPFGRGRQFLNHNGLVDRVVGGFQVSAIYQFLSGTPISWGNAIYTGSGYSDFHNVQHSSANVFGGKVFNTSVFDTRTLANPALPAQPSPYLPGYNPAIQPTGNNYRTFPQYLLRQDYTSNWDADIQKNTTIAEGVQLELRLDAFNVLNRPQYNTPNVSPTSASFGTTSGVYSGANARQLQLGAHITF